MSAKGEINLNAYLMEEPILDITLKELSRDIMNELRLDREASKIFMPLLDKGIISSSIHFNRLGEIKGIKVKDIDESIFEKDVRLNFQLLSPTYLIENLKNIYQLSRFYLNFKESNTLFNVQLNNVKVISEDINQINSNSILTIEDILLLINDKNDIKFQTGNLEGQNNIKEMNEKVYSSNNFLLNKIEFSMNKEKFDLNKFLMNISLNDVDKKSLLTVIDDYSKNNFDIDKYGQSELDNLFTLLNKGMELKFVSDLNDFNMTNIKSSNLSLMLNFKILENQLVLNNIKDDFLKNLLVTGQIKVDKKTLLKLSETEAFLKKCLEIAIEENDNYVFNIEIKNSQIKINNVDYNLIAEILGDFYFDLGNYYEAINFYEQAVYNGNEKAKFRLAYCYAQIDEKNKAIDTYLEYITKVNDFTAMNNLAHLYQDMEDYKNSVKWAEQAIKGGYNYNLFTLAYSYDMLKDYINAAKYYEKSIEQDKEVVSMWNLGLIYEFGKGNVSKDEKKAFNLYLSAANLNYESAIKKVSYMYRYGIGTNRDIKKANSWQSKNSNTEINEINDTLNVVKKEFYDNGIRLNIEYPEYIESDTVIIIKVSATNELPSLNSKGSVSVSFPQFSNINIVDNGSNIETKIYPSSSKLWNKNIKQTVTSNYFMYEGWESEWKPFETKTMSFSFSLNDISNLDNLNIFVRSVVLNNKIEYINPMNGIDGQQGYQNINISIPVYK